MIDYVIIIKIDINWHNAFIRGDYTFSSWLLIIISVIDQMIATIIIIYAHNLKLSSRLSIKLN